MEYIIVGISTREWLLPWQAEKTSVKACKGNQESSLCQINRLDFSEFWESTIFWQTWELRPRPTPRAHYKAIESWSSQTFSIFLKHLQYTSWSLNLVMQKNRSHITSSHPSPHQDFSPSPTFYLRPINPIVLLLLPHKLLHTLNNPSTRQIFLQNPDHYILCPVLLSPPNQSPHSILHNPFSSPIRVQIIPQLAFIFTRALLLKSNLVFDRKEGFAFRRHQTHTSDEGAGLGMTWPQNLEWKVGIPAELEIDPPFCIGKSVGLRDGDEIEMDRGKWECGLNGWGVLRVEFREIDRRRRGCFENDVWLPGGIELDFIRILRKSRASWVWIHDLELIEMIELRWVCFYAPMRMTHDKSLTQCPCFDSTRKEPLNGIPKRNLSLYKC